MPRFADINVSQGSVATYARCLRSAIEYGLPFYYYLSHRSFLRSLRGDLVSGAGFAKFMAGDISVPGWGAEYAGMKSHRRRL